MAMTAAVKDELSRVDVPKPCCRRAEMAALLRFAGGLHIVSGRVVVEAELDTGAVARRLRTGQVDINGAPFNHLAPFGGYGQSGVGREFGEHGYAEFCQVKSIQLPAAPAQSGPTTAGS